MINIVILEGRLGNDAICANKNAPVKFSMSTWENFRDENEESGWRTVTTWHQVTLWGKQENRKAKAESLKKGAMVVLRGSIKTNEWETSEGEHRKINEIVADFVKVVIKAGDNKSYNASNTSTTTQSSMQKEVPVVVEPEDDLPF